MKWLAIFCLGMLSFQIEAAQFVEISAEIESYGYWLGDTNTIAKAKPKTTKVLCITGTNEWYISNDYAQPEQWWFDGTNVCCRRQVTSGNSGSGQAGV